ncbi:polyphenol oxidase family protein [Flaviflexus sp.]|uniref:polyphenol oxidase family protein n=1 Tax=Flaviflexus sp. TaxID=1969482 RepID=UPI003F937FA8
MIIDFLSIPGALAGFTTRVPGTPPESYAGNLGYHVGDDPKNVDRWRAELQEQTGPLAWMSQVHGTTILDAQPHVQVADGLLVRPGQGAAVMVADCVPLLLIGRSNNDPVIGAVVHVGRAGLLGGIGVRGVEALRVKGAEQIEAIIGPAICGQCYEVGEAMAEDSEKVMPGSSCVTRWGTAGIDIPGALAEQLRSNGVEVRDERVCTMEDDRYFSHRRQKGQAGRFAGVLVLP